MFRESNLSSSGLSADFEPVARTSTASVRRARRPGLVYPSLLLLSLVVWGIVGTLHFGDRVPAYQLMDDPASYAQLEWYTGILSNAVVLLWCAAAAVCGFAGLLLRSSDGAHVQRLSRFLLVLAISSLWLTFDDLLLLHEQMARHLVGREYQHHAEGALFALYAAVMAVCFWRFRSVIARTEYWLLFTSVMFLLLSAAIDVSFQLELGGNNLFRETVLSVPWGASFIDISEEMLKLTGAMFWFAYCMRTGLAGVRTVISGVLKRPDFQSSDRTATS